MVRCLNCLHDLQAVENHYNVFARRDSSTKIKFEGSEITLDIPEDGELTKEGWKIIPITPTVVRSYTGRAVLAYVHGDN